MRHPFIRRLPAFALMFLSACGLVRCAPDPVDQATIDRVYAKPLEPPEGPVSVYFIGHSLIARDMPAMLQQLSPEGHRYESQLGWGAELEAHWEPDVEIAGHDVENNHPRFREAHDAVGSGEYDAVVLTEKVSLTDAIKYHDPWHYLSLWAEKVWQANPNARVYLYETWHEISAPEGWLNKIDSDLPTLWEREIVDRALAQTQAKRPIYIIPAGQVMARFVRELEMRGGIDGLTSEKDLFSDTIHPNDLGFYLVALTHYAAIYGRSPVGLPYRLDRADGTKATPPGPEAARLMQEIVWEVVSSYPRSGVTTAR